MSKTVAKIFGVIIILFVIATFVIPNMILPFSPFIAILLGILVMFTPLTSSGGQQIYGQTYPAGRGFREGFFAHVRRWFFGAYMVFAGIDAFLFTPLLPYVGIDQTIGKIIFGAIGLIYLVAASKHRNYQIVSA